MRTEEKVKLFFVSWATGIGAGVGRMESIYYRYLDKERFDPVFVFPGTPAQHGAQYDGRLPYHYLDERDKYRQLITLLSHADIVQFQGGCDPLVCEAARAAEVPVLIEVLHNIENGGAFPNIDATICVSRAVAGVQTQKERAKVILNGIDLDDFFFRTEPLPDDKIVLLQVSNRTKPYFNLDQIAEPLLALDPRIELWLAGPGQHLGSSPRIRFLGVVDNIVDYYRSADLMVLFSKQEPFGLAAIEAMACGCLPLVSAEAGFIETVDNGVDGWLVSPDPEAAVRAIEAVLEVRGSAQWEEMRAAARNKVETRFSAKGCVVQYEELYEELLARKGRRTKAFAVFSSPGTAESIIGEALVHSHLNCWEGVDGCLADLVESSLHVVNPLCREAARLFAVNTSLRGNGALAAKVFRLLFKSGESTLRLLPGWLPVAEAEDWEAIEGAVLAAGRTDAEIPLQFAERLLRAGELKKTIRLFEELASAEEAPGEAKKLYETYLAQCKAKLAQFAR